MIRLRKKGRVSRLYTPHENLEEEQKLWYCLTNKRKVKYYAI